MISSEFKIALPAIRILRSLTAVDIVRNILIVNIKANSHQAADALRHKKKPPEVDPPRALRGGGYLLSHPG